MKKESLFVLTVVAASMLLVLTGCDPDSDGETAKKKSHAVVEKSVVSAVDLYTAAARRGDAAAFQALLSKLEDASNTDRGKMLHALLLEYELKKKSGETLEQRLARLKAAYDGKLEIMDQLLASVTMAEAVAMVTVAGEKNSVGVLNTLLKKTLSKRSRSVEATYEFAQAMMEKIREAGLLIEMVRIPDGKFQMGDIAGMKEGEHIREWPVHEVRIRSFSMSKFEVTQAQWRRVMGSNPSSFTGDNRPVEQVSWDDIQEFIGKLNKQTGKHYRLPTEAEWEYAARAGTETEYPWGSSASHDDANYGDDECCTGKVAGRDQWVNTSPVGSFPPNAWGLYDMHGNVWEWVEDCYRENYRGAPSDGRAWTSDECKKRVLRGGSWNVSPYFLRSASRFRISPDNHYSSYGFRLVQD